MLYCAAMTNEFEGIISVTARGTGYVPFEGHEQDIEIATENLNTALNKDLVSVRLLPQKKNGRVQGEVTAILSRSKDAFVGVLEKRKEGYFLSADDNRMYADIHIADIDGAKEGDKLYVRITSWETQDAYPEGEILRVIGRHGEHNVEMEAIVLEHNFDTRFPESVTQEAEALAKKRAITKDDIESRRDFRDTLTLTIDPVDAKDFDDALSFKQLDNGNIEVGIHIADVTHYVEPGSAIDEEAQRRGTSIYLVDRTIPMLPEILSNDICSLREGEDRLAFAAVFTFNEKHEVVTRWFGRTVIHSNKRFSYEEAQSVLNTNEGPYAHELKTLNTIAYALREKRRREGSIGFEQDEVKFTLDEKGNPTGVYVKERTNTNLLIEDFMLLANKAVAEYIHELGKGKKELLFIYRIHDVPKEEKIDELGVFVRAMGYDFETKKGSVTPEAINSLLKQIEGAPEEKLIQLATIRSMAKAVYSTKNIGHFSLSFKHYTHFTSPIRRYPDIMVHRILWSHLDGSPIPQDELRRYQRLAIESSQREIEAIEAERDSTKYMQVKFMLGKIGQEFDATISGLTDFGMFVEENESKAEGLIRFADMDDYYTLKDGGYVISGEKKGKEFTLGDSVRVKLIAADLESKRLSFALLK